MSELDAMTQDLNCTCVADDYIAYHPSYANYPCPVHGYVYATVEERLELLEARVTELERRTP